MKVRLINEEMINSTAFNSKYVGCIILTKDKKILLQKRGNDWKSFPGFVVEFGGHVEEGETPAQAVMREIKEELGGDIKEEELISFGAITEESTQYNELIYCFFWFDKKGTISGCYEGEPVYFDNVQAVLMQPKLTEGFRWLLGECQKKQLLK